MNKVFVTSDLHLGHYNIIRYCNRPFKSTGLMDAAIINTWNARVDVNDTVYFLGDFAMGPRVDEHFILRMLATLNGKIIIILGNHDEPYKKQKGLADIIDHYELEIEILPAESEIQYDGKTFVLNHYPMGNWEAGAIHLHGHLHTQYVDYVVAQNATRQRYDVGVDMYGGPVQLTGDCRYLNDPRGWK